MKPRHLLGAAAIAATLSGCANKYDTVTPELRASMLADLRSGRLSLDCGQKCSFTWIGQAAAIHPLDMAERWDELAVRVMQIGYGSDLAYYYLGQAAQGLGYHRAAIGYYQFAFALANGQDALLRCESGQGNGGDPCQGVDIAASIPLLVQASQNALDQQATAAPMPRRRSRSNVTPARASSGGGPSWAQPPAPAGGSGPGWVAPPAAASGSPGWAAPPPATQ